jgi:hypothetical protein
MNKLSEALIFTAVLAVFLVGLKLAHGSLSELQNEATQEDSYRSELIGYLYTHNMTKDTQLRSDPLKNVNVMDINEMEAVVKDHMQDCQSGLYNRTYAFIQKSYEDKDGDGKFDATGIRITDDDRKGEREELDAMGTC